MQKNANTTLARLDCDERTARTVADALSERFDDGVAVAAFEAAGARWTVEAHFEEPPDAAEVCAAVAQAAGTAVPVTFETIAAKDWVAASLGELKPVTAGRFTVHGTHDRARVSAKLVTASPSYRCRRR